MALIKLGFIGESHGLHSQLQAIEDQLLTIKSTQEVGRLTKKLDKTFLALQEMKSKAQDVFGGCQQKYFEELGEEIIHLYGKIRNAWISRKVAQIQEETDGLKSLIDNETLSDSKAINVLKRHIFLLLRDYRPGLEDRQVIAKAHQTILEAQLKLSSAPSSLPVFPKVEGSFEDFSLQDTLLDPAVCEDLFDIAALIYNGKIREAKAQLHHLPSDAKEIFERHLRALTTIAFDDRVETIQALLATMNQLLQRPEPYATRSQIDEIFLGLQAVVREEQSTHIRIRLPS